MKKLALILLLCPIFVHGQDSLRSVQLQEITVSSVFYSKKITPVSYTNLSDSALKSISFGQEPSFIFTQTPSFTNYSDNGSSIGYSYVRLRGIDQTRINMTLDGVPLNEPEDQGVYFNNYPDFISNVDNIQIQRGVGVSKNGSASFAGSIAFTSHNVFSTPNTSRVGVSYGSFNTYRLFAEHNTKINKGLTHYIRASELGTNGYKYDSWNRSRSIFYTSSHVSNRSNLKLVAFAGNQRNSQSWLGVPLELINLDERTNANNNEEDNFTQTFASLQYTYLLTHKVSVRTASYYNYLNGNYDFDLDNFLSLPTQNQYYNYALESNFSGLITSINYESNEYNVVLGYHGNLYNRIHRGSFESQDLYTNQGIKNESTVFGKATISKNDITFFTDAQYRTTNFNYNGLVDFSTIRWKFFNYLLGASVKINPQTIVYTSYGTTSREPTRTNIFGGNDEPLADESNQAITFVTTPETVQDYEMGIRFTKNAFYLSVNGFYMNFKDEITLNGQFGPNGLALQQSVDKSYRTGIELETSFKLSTFSVELAGAYMDSRIEDGNVSFEPILTPKYTFSLSPTYKVSKFQFTATTRYQSSSYIDLANTTKLDDFIVVNTVVSYTADKYTFSLFGNNILNKRYFANGYVDFDGVAKYHVQAPINYSVQLVYTF